jgi:hypothetical protein
MPSADADSPTIARTTSSRLTESAAPLSTTRPLDKPMM